MDLPLVPVLLRMEQAGVRIDSGVLSAMSTRLAVEMDTLADRIYARPANPRRTPRIASTSTRPSSSATCSSTRCSCPSRRSTAKAKLSPPRRTSSKSLPSTIPSPRWSSNIASSPSCGPPISTRCRTWSTPKAASTPPSIRSAPRPDGSRRPTRTCKTFPSAPRSAARFAPPSSPRRATCYVRRLLADRAPPHGPLLPGSAAARRLPHRPGHPHAHGPEVFGVPAASIDKETRNRAKAVNFGIVYGISPFGLAAQLGIDQSEAARLHRRATSSATPACAASSTRPSNVRRDRLVRTCSAASGPSPTSSRATPTARLRRTHRHQHAAAGHRRRPDQARHDRASTREISNGISARMTLQVHDELLFDVDPRRG